MSLEFCVLGSGSSGNATVVRAPSGAFLIDAGFGPRTTEKRLHGTGVALKDIAAIVLTHLDSDHFNPHWLRTILKQRIRIHVSAKRVKDFLKIPEVRDMENGLFARPLAEGSATTIHELLVPFGDTLEPLPRVEMRALPLAHDETGSHGFHITCSDIRAGFATDLGHVPPELIDAFLGVDFLAIESNYDPLMEETSDRPYYLKQRIMGGHGHLSNDQALAAIQQILDRTHAQLGPEDSPATSCSSTAAGSAIAPNSSTAFSPRICASSRSSPSPTNSNARPGSAPGSHANRWPRSSPWRGREHAPSLRR